ncbi:MAG TPA: ribonuclease HIII, partial [Thermodesulfobacteriota bacterium]|nr:ribonuclease HIII [Thermodesulfobacteriota bacterium]
AEAREEQYCDYSYRFEDGEERIIVKQYANGKLQFQGIGGNLYRSILDGVITLYNLKHPDTKLSVGGCTKDEHEEGHNSGEASLEKPQMPRTEIPLPHIGTDESGKGDYFGPMVVAGVWIDESAAAEVEAIGVKDSKLLSDNRCQNLASEIKIVCHGKFVEVEIPPERYNDLYDQFRKERKNLNHLLAWGHARAMESLLEKNPCSYAVADQFGNERFILSKLMEKGKKLQLIQTPKAERYTAVAAASILARDRFLWRMERMSHEYGISLPKGASDRVIQPALDVIKKRGIDELRKVAKLHHKTTQKILRKIQT